MNTNEIERAQVVAVLRAVAIELESGNVNEVDLHVSYSIPRLGLAPRRRHGLSVAPEMLKSCWPTPLEKAKTDRR